MGPVTECWVVKSMSTEVQQAHFREQGDVFKLVDHWLVFEEHMMSAYGNCQRCGWRPKDERAL